MIKSRLFSPFLYVFAVLIVGIGCENKKYEATVDLYREAVADAVFADKDEIYDGLVAITRDNDNLEWHDGMVLVVTFTRFPDSYPEGENIQTWWGETWVTAVPELKTFYGGIAVAVDNPVLRIEQVLGLQKDSGNEWFAELWVNPDDLYRPCPDSEITDSVCGLTFPENTAVEYIDWFNNQIIESYCNEQKYPWTRLGYTYDWCDLTYEIGLSEFIIRQGAKVLVERLERFEDYL
jgi:hypothetical protein